MSMVLGPQTQDMWSQLLARCLQQNYNQSWSPMDWLTYSPHGAHNNPLLCKGKECQWKWVSWENGEVIVAGPRSKRFTGMRCRGTTGKPAPKAPFQKPHFRNAPLINGWTGTWMFRVKETLCCSQHSFLSSLRTYFWGGTLPLIYGSPITEKAHTQTADVLLTMQFLLSHYLWEKKKLIQLLIFIP